MIKLTPRLKIVAEMVNKCEHFADIGTDHAYLAGFIVQNGIADKALASDINPNPLKNAERTVFEEQLGEKIELRLSAGFENIKPDEADEIAIAGMGGLMIAGMIDSTPWLKDKAKHLVLQPMTHSEDVRRALLKNGFEITAEKTVREGKHIYLALSARFNGDDTAKPPYWYYVGDLIKSTDQTDALFVEKELKSLKRQYDGLKASGTENIELAEIIRSIENAKGN